MALRHEDIAALDALALELEEDELEEAIEAHIEAPAPAANGFAMIATNEAVASNTSTGTYGYLDDIIDIDGVPELLEGLRAIKRGHADKALGLLMEGITAYSDRTGKQIPW